MWRHGKKRTVAHHHTVFPLDRHRVSKCLQEQIKDTNKRHVVKSPRMDERWRLPLKNVTPVIVKFTQFNFQWWLCLTNGSQNLTNAFRESEGAGSRTPLDRGKGKRQERFFCTSPEVAVSTGIPTGSGKMLLVSEPQSPVGLQNNYERHSNS